MDEAQVGQVIRGIILNAREATPQGGMIRVRAENVVITPAEHPPLPAGDYFRVSIADQGAGIPSLCSRRCFDHRTVMPPEIG